MTTTHNDPILIGLEQLQEALTSLGITNLATIREVRLRPNKLEVVRKVLDEGGQPVIEGDDIVCVTYTIPVVVDDEAVQAIQSEGGA